MTRDFTLEDIAKLINDSESRLEARLIKRINEKFEEAKGYAEERFNWLAKKTGESLERLEDRIDAQGIEMRNGFRTVDKKLDSLKRDHATRIDFLEEKVL